MKPDYQYYAFISYKREDIEWARWLRRKLERYKPSVALRAEYPHIPQQIKVFMDETDLIGGILPEEINKALDSSRYLIVVCSPRSAKECFVNQEIAYFLENHPVESVAPVIVEGIPYSGGATECFNAEIRKIPKEKELNAINVQKLTKREVIAQLLATIFKVDYRLMWDRYKKAEAKQKNLKIAVISVLALLLSLSYFLFSSFDASIRLEEQEQHSLPFKGGSITIDYGGKVEREQFADKDSAVVFPKIHSKYLKQKVRIIFASEGYISLDTVVALQRKMLLPVKRDSSKAIIMGNVTEIKGADPMPIANVAIEVKECQLHALTDSGGFFRIVVPLALQCENYNIVLCKDGYNNSNKNVRPDSETIGRYNLIKEF